MQGEKRQGLSKIDVRCHRPTRGTSQCNVKIIAIHLLWENQASVALEIKVQENSIKTFSLIYIVSSQAGVMSTSCLQYKKFLMKTAMLVYKWVGFC